MAWHRQDVSDAFRDLLLKSLVEKGGPGSGNFGHAGRPNQVGGSAPGRGGKKLKPIPGEEYIPGEPNERPSKPGKIWDPVNERWMPAEHPPNAPQPPRARTEAPSKPGKPGEKPVAPYTPRAVPKLPPASERTAPGKVLDPTGGWVPGEPSRSTAPRPRVPTRVEAPSKPAKIWDPVYGFRRPRR